MPNLVVSSSQRNVAKRPDFFPAKIPSTCYAAKPQVAPNPYSKPNSDLRRNPAVDSVSSSGTSERIVPVFTSKVRTAIPRGATHPAAGSVTSQPAAAKSTNAPHPSGVFKPTFPQAPALQRKPGTNATSKSSSKPLTGKVIGVSQKNPACTDSTRSKDPAERSSKSAGTFRGLGSSETSTKGTIGPGRECAQQL